MQNRDAIVAEAKRLQFLGKIPAARQQLQQWISTHPEDQRGLGKLFNFLLLASADLSADQFKTAYQQWYQFQSQHACKARPFNNSRDPQRPLKIGYLSGDFGYHALNHVILYFFQFHDPRLFEVYIYSTTQPEDLQTDWYKSHCQQFHNIADLSVAEAVEQITRDQIDILVDLSGFGERNRLEIFLERPAPLQINAGLGMMSTTALPNMDYRLSDPVICPEALLDLNTEKVIYLSHHLHWQPFEELYELPVAAPPFLQKGFISFGCANRTYKLNPEVIRLWSQILQQVPDSRLYLKCCHFDQSEYATYFEKAFQEQGVSKERLIFVGQTSVQEHYKFWNEVDIALDPFPYQGGLTTFEALFMGVPVIALDQLTGPRTSVGILHSLGYPDLAAQSPSHYLSIACNFARQTGVLVELRQKLRQLLLNSPLCNGLAYTRELENAYRWLWQQWCHQKPVHTGSWPEQVTGPPLPPQNFPDSWQSEALQQAHSCYARQQFEAAADICRDLLSQPHPSGEAFYLLGLIAFQTGHTPSATQLLRQALQRLPERADIHFNLAGILASEGETLEAQAHYKAALQYDPELKPLYQQRGIDI